MSPGSTDEANGQPPSCRGRCAQVDVFARQLIAGHRLRAGGTCRRPECPVHRRGVPSTKPSRRGQTRTIRTQVRIGDDMCCRVLLEPLRRLAQTGVAGCGSPGCGRPGQLGGRTTDYAHRRMSPRGGWVAGVAQRLAVDGERLVLPAVLLVPALQRAVELFGVDADEEGTDGGLARGLADPIA